MKLAILGLIFTILFLSIYLTITHWVKKSNDKKKCSRGNCKTDESPTVNESQEK